MKIKEVLQVVTKSTLDLLFPPKCLGCNKEGAYFCPPCFSSLPRLEPPFCRACAQPVSSGDTCRRCQGAPLNIDGIIAPFRMEGPVRSLVHRFKYNDLRALAPYIVLLLAEHFELAAPNAFRFDFMTAMPMYPGKERRRGYNQAVLIARELSALLDVPLRQTLRRVKNSPPQASSRNMEERRRNVQEAFAYLGQPIDGANVLLIDDVCTTGSTMNACSQVLKEAGAYHVWGFAVAREVLKD